jgi:UDP-GlcNAc3NAcA epimerase
MPEEINRITADHCSTLLFSPTKAGVLNLTKEGFKFDNTPPYSMDNPGVFHCGEVMYDNALHFSDIAERKSDILKMLGVERDPFILATIHRDNNTDIPERLEAIFKAMLRISLHRQIILPLHPRTQKMLENHPNQELISAIRNSEKIILIPPVSFFEMIVLEKHASLIMTDSGGVQKESFFYQKPCIILRPETEWVEIVENGSAIIADADEEKIMKAYHHFEKHPPSSFPPLFGDGRAAWFILETLLSA